MRNLIIFLAFAFVFLLLFNIWGSLNSKLVAIESTTGSYLPAVTPGPRADNAELLEKLAQLESMQAENASAIEAILAKLEALPAGNCGDAACGKRVSRREVIYFEHDSSDLSAAETLKIDRLLDSLVRDSIVSLRGHADTSGDNLHNHLLSLRRAAAVKSYLDGKLGGRDQADTPLITISAAGEELTMTATGDGVEERSNRAVEILVYR